jgi:SAM-dependent methyltransferase
LSQRSIFLEEVLPNDDGIVDLLRERSTIYEPWLNLPPRDELRQELRKGVADTLAKFAKSPLALSAVRRNIYDATRGSWQTLCPIRPTSRILDFGCGLGNISRALARRAGQVIGVDACHERLLINKAVNDEAGISNVDLICGNHQTIDRIRPKSIDGIVLNGVLEWIPTHVAGSPRRVQVEFLRSCRRILADDGWLYLGIENRWGFRYFLGRPDDHSGLVFSSLLPRAAADIYSRLMRGRPYRTYTYGPKATAALLREAGFGATTIYATIPDYRDYDILMPQTGNARLASVASRFGIGKPWKRKLCESRWFLRRVVPCFALVASAKTRHIPAWLMAGGGHLAFNHIYVKHDQASIWYEDSQKESMIREVALTDLADAKHDKIERLSRVLSGNDKCPLSLRECVRNASNGFTWLDRRTVIGQALSTVSLPQRRNELPAVLNALRKLHSLAAEILVDPLSIQGAFYKIAPNATRDVPAQTLAIVARLLARLSAIAPKERLLMHGDCKPANIIVTKQAAEFIDWEWAEIVNYPGYDVLKLHWAEREDPNRIDYRGNDHVVEEYLQDKDAEKSCRYVHPDAAWPTCVLMYWATRLARSIALFKDGGMPQDWVPQVIVPALRSMCRVAGVNDNCR